MHNITIINQITLYQYKLLSIILGIISICIFCIDIYVQVKYRTETIQTKFVDIMRTTPDSANIKPIRRWTLGLLCISTVICMICTGTFILYNHMAIEHGAYGNVQLNQNLSEIYDSAIHGFKESENIPNDLTGAIVIYFKYGCKDCNNTHDSIMDMVKDRPDIYFVSTRSKKGEELLNKYSVEAVPSAVYICHNNDISFLAEILYIENGNDTIFRQDKLDYLLTQQDKQF